MIWPRLCFTRKTLAAVFPHWLRWRDEAGGISSKWKGLSRPIPKALLHSFIISGRGERGRNSINISNKRVKGLGTCLTRNEEALCKVGYETLVTSIKQPYRLTESISKREDSVTQRCQFSPSWSTKSMQFQWYPTMFLDLGNQIFKFTWKETSFKMPRNFR